MTFDDTSLGSGLSLLHNFLRQSRRPTLSTRDGSPSQQFSLKILSTWHPHNYWWKLTQDAPPCQQDSRDGSPNQQSTLKYYQLVTIASENSPRAVFKVLKVVLNILNTSPSPMKTHPGLYSRFWKLTQGCIQGCLRKWLRLPLDSNSSCDHLGRFQIPWS